MSNQNQEKQSECSDILGVDESLNLNQHQWDDSFYPTTGEERRAALDQYRRDKKENKPILPDELDINTERVAVNSMPQEVLALNLGADFYQRYGEFWESKIESEGHFGYVCRRMKISGEKLERVLEGKELLTEKQITLMNKVLKIKPYELKKNRLKI